MKEEKDRITILTEKYGDELKEKLFPSHDPRGTDSASAGPGRDPNNPSTIGTTFEILFIDNFTGTISTDGTDKFVGSVMVGVDDGAKKAFVPAAANDVVNLLGEAGAGNATKGGLKGSRIKFTATAENTYMVEGLLIGDGTIATPFGN